MKKVLAGFSLVATSLLFAPSAFADSSISACPYGTQFGGLCYQAGQLGTVIGNAINFVFVLAGIVALGYLIYGGIKWVISEGDKSNVESARNHIVASIVGLIIIFMSYLVLNVVLNFFAGVSLMNLTLTKLPGCIKTNDPSRPADSCCITLSDDGTSCRDRK